MCARPSGRQPSATESRAGIRRPYTVYPPSPSSSWPAAMSRLAVATTSPCQPAGEPVGSRRRPTLATLMPSSSPIR
ncbi:Uncharacterised protein [Bordetella pertussis]|nr:Uncharacterised protein [Bordetella pertussis]